MFITGQSDEIIFSMKKKNVGNSKYLLFTRCKSSISSPTLDLKTLMMQFFTTVQLSRK